MTYPPRSFPEPPSATYRLQFNQQFTFDAARDLTAYLHELGISHCYCSPLFEARPESTHGYDICRFDRLNPRLGTPGAFDRFVQSLQELGMGVLLDLVPNHMAADLCNPWWAEVLEHGRGSPHSDWFDVQWEPADEVLRDRVLLPILEDRYARVLESGKLRVVFERGRFALRYHERKLPLSSESHAQLVTQLEEACATHQHGHHDRELQEGVRQDISTRSVTAGLAVQAKSSPFIREVLPEFLARLNGTVGDPRSFDPLHELLQAQHYRLAYWRTGPDRINYRRFFDVSELVSLRMELPEVFQATHQLVRELLAAGKVEGLRIDHPDGLWDPGTYLKRLRASCRAEAKTASIYIVVEKILTGSEGLPPEWPVQGTTGYDFLNRVNGIFINRANDNAFDTLYREFTGVTENFLSITERSKRQVLSTSFASELRALTCSLQKLAAHSRYSQDFTWRELRSGLFEILVAFPIYRTYLSETSSPLNSRQTDYIHQAARQAADANLELNPAVLDFIEHLLSARFPPDWDEAQQKEGLGFAMKFQQIAGPVMAKGLEDTAFYRYLRLISLNEVGGDPGRFGTDQSEFHDHNLAIAAEWPHSLLATSTHDTKRGEDARARINVLSEMPEEWRQALVQWQTLNAQRKARVRGIPAPDANDEYLLYQTLVGMWPNRELCSSELSELSARATTFMRKALREAKVHTSWTDPDSAYEDATLHFVEQLLQDVPNNRFLQEFNRFQRRVAFFGELNSLSQTLLKMTCPGVPDFYQGAELWDFNLVDPDNRRPVDYSLRQRLLADLRQRWDQAASDVPGFLADLLEHNEEGEAKLYLIWQTLRFRREHRELFAHAGYTSLGVSGKRAGHVCTFSRSFAGAFIVVVVPRLVFGLTHGAEELPLGEPVWLDTVISLPEGLGPKMRNVLTGETLIMEPGRATLPLEEALRHFPVALLANAASA